MGSTPSPGERGALDVSSEEINKLRGGVASLKDTISARFSVKQRGGENCSRPDPDGGGASRKRRQRSGRCRIRARLLRQEARQDVDIRT
jgi:hypothetical protein